MILNIYFLNKILYPKSKYARLHENVFLAGIFFFILNSQI